MDILDILSKIGGFLQGLSGIYALIITGLGLYWIVKQTGLLIQQSRHLATSSTASLYEEIASHVMSIDQIFVQYPKIRPYFYENQPLDNLDRSSEKYLRIASMAELILDFMDLWVTIKIVAESQQTIGELQQSLQGWEKFFKDIVHTSPALKERYYENPDWWTDAIKRFFE